MLKDDKVCEASNDGYAHFIAVLAEALVRYIYTQMKRQRAMATSEERAYVTALVEAGEDEGNAQYSALELIFTRQGEQVVRENMGGMTHGDATC